MHQLEVTGHWEWAVFVALHDPSPAQRTVLVKQLLQRHYPALANQQARSYREKRNFLLNQLHIPESVRAHFDRLLRLFCF